MAENSVLDSVQDLYIDTGSPRIRLSVYPVNGTYTHKLLIKKGLTTVLTLNIGTITPMSGTIKAPSTVFVSLSASNVATLGAAFPNVASFRATFTLQTYQNNTQKGSDSSLQALIAVTEENSSPTMGSWSCADVSTAGYAVSGNTAKLVNGISTARFSNISATAKNGATITRYSITTQTGEQTDATAGTYDWDWSTQYKFGNSVFEQNIQFTITAYDSRGFSNSVSNYIAVIPYDPLKVNVCTIKRNSSTPTRPSFIVDGIYSRVGQNNVSASFKYREAGVNTWSNGGSLTVTKDSGGVITNHNTFHLNTTATGVTLDEDKIWVVQLIIQDSTGELKQYTLIAYLTPSHMHLSFRENALGIGGVPTGTNTVEVDASWKLVTKGKMDTGSAKYYRSGDYSINMRDSDIIGANGIYFYDLADARDEGLVFPCTTTGKWDTFYVSDGDAYIRRNHDIDAYVAGSRLLTVDDLYYKGGDTLTLNYAILPGHITSAYKSIRLGLTVPKLLTNITSVTVNTMTGTMRGNNGYLDSASTDRNWLNYGTTSVTIVSPNMIRLDLNTTNAISNVDINTPIEFYAGSNGLVLTFNA